MSHKTSLLQVVSANASNFLFSVTLRTSGSRMEYHKVDQGVETNSRPNPLTTLISECTRVVLTTQLDRLSVYIMSQTCLTNPSYFILTQDKRCQKLLRTWILTPISCNGRRGYQGQLNQLLNTSKYISITGLPCTKNAFNFC